MLPFLGKARVVDDPRFDRSVTFQLWQHQFPHLRENLLVRPSSLADKVQQRLMLGCGPFWRCDRGHRLHALAPARHHQAQAIIAKRLGPVRMPDHAREPIHIGQKRALPSFDLGRPIPASPPLKYESCQIDDSPLSQPRLSDSVRLEGWSSPLGAQVGIVGTDFLSLRTIEFHYEWSQS